MTLLLVMVGGAAGALVRYLADRLLPGARIPVATLAVNVVGSFLLGALAGAGSAVPPAVTLLLGVGFCGALTTWSTFAFQTLGLPVRWAVVNVTVTLVLGLGAALLGHVLVH